MSVQFNIMTYNVMLPLLPPIKIYGQLERLQRVPRVVELCKQECSLDAVVLCEVIPPSVYKTLITSMAAIGFSFYTKPLKDVLTGYGGVVVFSKREIHQQAQTLYGETCSGADCLSAKGVTYARVEKDGLWINIFATHLQAWPGIIPQLVRENQMKYIRQSITSLAIPADEPVLLCGDMNADLYTSKDFIQHLSYSLDVVVPEVHDTSHPFTFDSATNRLVGSDDISSYTSKSWSDGCVKEYLATTYCPCCPREWLDYTMFSSRHLKPTSSSMQSIAIKVDKFPMPFHATDRIIDDMQDVSDHYPVIGRFSFELGKKTEKNIQVSTFEVGRNSNTTQMWKIIVLIISFVVFIALVIFGLQQYSIGRILNFNPVIVNG